MHTQLMTSPTNLLGLIPIKPPARIEGERRMWLSIKYQVREPAERRASKAAHAALDDLLNSSHPCSLQGSAAAGGDLKPTPLLDNSPRLAAEPPARPAN